MSRKRVFFVAYGGGHVAMVMPVMRALQAKHPDWQLDLMALTTAEQVARRAGWPTLSYRDYAHWYDADRLRELAAPLLPATAHPLVSAEESLAYLGINMADLHTSLGAQGAAQRYAAVGRWAFHPIHFMRRLLGELRPDVVVATNSPRSEAAALEAATGLGIPGLCMVDLFSPPGDPFFERTHYAETITTIDTLGRRNLIAGGVPAERIHITGHPAFDALADPQRIAAAAAERERLGWRGHKVILWAGNLEQFMPSEGPQSDPAYLGLRVEHSLREWVAGQPDAALLIRYHPNQVQHFEPGPAHPRVFWSDPLTRHPHLDIHLADIVVVNGSTIGLEAAIAGKSVLSMDNSPSRHVFPLSDYGVSLGVPDFDALTPMVARMMREPQRSAFADQCGQAADSVARLIEQAAA